MKISRIQISFSLLWTVAISSLLLLAPRASLAETYLVDSDHSKVGFRIKHLGIGWIEGIFTEFAGKFDFDPADISKSKVEAIIKTGSLYTGATKRDQHLKSKDFFDVRAFQDMRFLSNNIEIVSPDQFKVSGALTIKGVGKQVVLDVTYGGSVRDPWGIPRAAFQAKTTIKRKDFGITWDKILENGTPLIAEDVEITMNIQGVIPMSNAPKFKEKK